MKRTLLKSQRRRFFLHSGFLALTVCLLFTSTSLAQLADTRIAFASDRNLAWNADIYLMDPDGKRVRQLTEQLKTDTEPAWSPDGQKITFVSYRDVKKRPEPGIEIWRGEIYVMNADGTNPINLTQSPERPDGVSSWSPDGNRLHLHQPNFLTQGLLPTRIFL